MNITYIKIDKIKPYENNPRINDNAIDKVAESIKQFGFKQPIVLDKDYNIIVGHTRTKAAKKLNIDEVPCLVADDLTEEKIKAYRLADNKTNEFSSWDMDKLKDELKNVENLFTGFDKEEIDSILKDININDFFEGSEAEEKKQIKVFCPRCGFEFENG